MKKLIAVSASAVIDVVSDRDHEDLKSTTDVECSDGAFLAGIALKRTYAAVGN